MTQKSMSMTLAAITMLVVSLFVMYLAILPKLMRWEPWPSKGAKPALHINPVAKATPATQHPLAQARNAGAEPHHPIVE